VQRVRNVAFASLLVGQNREDTTFVDGNRVTLDEFD
jgi:hypothetical protein